MNADINNPNAYDVESNIDSYAIQSQQKFRYLVKWKDSPNKFNIKEPIKHLTNCAEVIWMFHELNPGKPQLPNYIHKRSSLQKLV